MKLTQSALVLAQAGFKVFPCSPNSKVPLKGWTAWEGKATSDVKDVLRIWNKNPLANIGVATGPSRLVVVDFDAAKNPHEFSGIEAFRTAYPDAKLPKTYTVSTAGGGWHLYYTTGEYTLRNSAGLLATRVDTRAEGGYVLGPGSVIEGNEYKAVSPCILAQLPQLPIWVADRLNPNRHVERKPVEIRGSASAYALAALRGECQKIRETGEGGRNHAVNRAAWNVSRFLINDELSEEQATDELLHAAGVAGLGHGEALAAVTSGLTAGQAHYASV